MTTNTNMTMVARNWRDLIRPKGITVDTESATDSYAKFTCEPLERGFGITIGNSLRRVLLSSLQGAAITAVRIEGALHEFTSVPDVVDDVGDIILNLKEVVFKAHSARTYTVRVDKEGPGPVYASDIELVDGLQVLNPNHLIAVLDKKGPLSMELTVNVGRGYVPAERNKTPTMSIGTIPIDALFSPIRKVNYTIQNARVGQVTDYDKLTLEVWTNGSVVPQDAVALPQRSSRNSSRFGSTSKSPRKRATNHSPATKNPSTRISSAPSRNSNSAFGVPTASKTRTSL